MSDPDLLYIVCVKISKAYEIGAVHLPSSGGLKWRKLRHTSGCGGKADIAVYSDEVWWRLSSLSGGSAIEYFGPATDYPLGNSTVTP